LFNGNRITSITSRDVLPTKIDTLDLSDNPVSNITSDALLAVSQTLKSIKFRGSNFVALPSALEILDNLDTLDIEGDTFTVSDITASKLAESVLYLRLANIGLSGWPAWLGKFVFLRKLYLEGNTRLGNLPINTFNIWRLELTDLSLSNNGATSVAAVSVLEKLQWLDISKNRLADAMALSFDLIPLGNTLKYLDVSSNILTSEPRLADLRVLTEVYIGSNRIANVTNGAFASTVVSLNFDYNLLTSIPKFLNDLTALQNFSIQSNLISSVGAHDFPVNSRLVSVYLGGNPISYIDEHGFDNVRLLLTYLDLENTKLERLPLALKVLTKLQTLWIPSNTLLVCTCEEKSLAPWIISLPTLRVVGQCGNVDIKEFIGQLASLCP